MAKPAFCRYIIELEQNSAKSSAGDGKNQRHATLDGCFHFLNNN